MRSARKILIVTLLLALVLSLTGCKSSDYKKAVSLAGEGSYAEASELFKALGDYQDSAAQARECDYRLAKAELNDGAYADAEALFTALGDYEDSAELAEKAHGKYLIETIGGSWDSTSMTIGGQTPAVYMNGMMQSVLNDDTLDFDFTGLVYDYTLSVSGEEATLTLDKEAFVNSFGPVLKDTLLKSYENAIIQSLEGSRYTFEDVLKEYGCENAEQLYETAVGESINDLVDQIADMMKEALEQENMTGKLRYEDGTLTLGDGFAVEFDESADTLKLVNDEAEISFKRAA